LNPAVEAHEKHERLERKADIYARQLDLSIGRGIADLEALANAATPEDAQQQFIFSVTPLTKAHQTPA